MKRDQVQSKAFFAQGYDPKTQTLEIQYHSGAVYQHKGVPETLYQCFLAAPSMGSYLNSGIKPAYDAERQPDAVPIWICGRNVVETEQGIVWELQGVFTTKENAIDACVGERYFVGPGFLDVNLPVETTEWEGCYYPLYKEEDEEVPLAPND